MCIRKKKSMERKDEEGYLMYLLMDRWMDGTMEEMDTQVYSFYAKILFLPFRLDFMVREKILSGGMRLQPLLIYSL